MGLRTSLPFTARRRPKRAARKDAPRTIIPVPEAGDTAVPITGLGAPRGATSPAGPLDVARLDAARERLRSRIAPVVDDD